MRVFRGSGDIRDKFFNTPNFKGDFGALMPKFDWYQASVVEGVDNLLESACGYFPDHDFRPDRGISQYDHCMAFYAPGALTRSFEINFGGNNNAPPNVKATGGKAPAVSDWLRVSHPVHRVTRLDSACDLWGEGLADQVFEDMDRVHHATPRLKRSDHGFHSPENGRTYYLGAPSSRVRVRAYEKGLEQGLGNYEPHCWWLRLELQMRPPKAADGRRAAVLTPFAAWGASTWSRDLMWAILQRDPEPYEWTRLVEPSPSESLRLLYQQRRRLLLAVGPEEAHRLLDEMFAADFAPREIEFVSPDGEIVAVQGRLI